MKSTGLLLILLVTIVVLAGLSHVDTKSKQGHISKAEISGNNIGLNRDILNRDKMPQIYGKIKLPAELSIELLPSENSKAPLKSTLGSATGFSGPTAWLWRTTNTGPFSM